MNDLENKIRRAEGLLCGLILKQPEALDDYNINKKLLSAEALFYIGITERLLAKGLEVIDEVAFSDEVSSIPQLSEKYEVMGGYNTVREMANVINVNNGDAIFDEWTKWNLVKRYKEKGILDIDLHWDKLLKMNSSQVPDFIEYLINDTDIDVCTDIEFENLDLTDKEIADIKQGLNMGIQYGKHSPILNYLSMGLPKADLTMFSSFTNGGKSSFTMNNIIIPIAEQKKKVTIVANEQQCIVYKLLLQTYVLTEKLNYWSLTRKKFKGGKWSEEDDNKVAEARQLIAKDYSPYMTFVKLYDYDMKKVQKIAKKQVKRGCEVLVYDTMKYSGEDDSAWMSLLQDSKAIFQICSKNNLAGVITFQLAPSLKNKLRTLDESALANGKQVAEVFSEMFAFRDIWDDEYEGEPFDIKPYKLKKDSNGKFTREKQTIPLDKTKKYKIFFHFKTRNDEVGNAVLYEFIGHQNKWVEKGYCHPHQKNRF
jgi:hypothetical protein